MGCGRVGSSLADGLSRIGHDVAVIDRDSAAFNRLSPEFAGERVLGQGFDRDVLLRAGIEGADAFAAVSSGDNSNIISARLAREIFQVPRVVARIYDAKRAQVYERRGIPTIATVPWTTARLLDLFPPGTATTTSRHQPPTGFGGLFSPGSTPVCSRTRRRSSRPGIRSKSPPYPAASQRHWPSGRC